MFIRRAIGAELQELLKEYPVVTILGPRQAGKTTLAKESLKEYSYANLEDPETREIAQEDPKAFLARHGDRVVVDEVQRVPELLSHIQVRVDEVKGNGQYVLTGSHQLSLREAISQSLAGRTAILNLLPFSISELKAADIQFDRFEDYCFTGFLPRIYEESQRPTTAYSNYYQTYIERDVRQLIQLKDASLFEKLIKLLAGRTGQVLDYSSLANDVGVDAKTVRHWISILEASFIVFKLSPYFENFGKRVIKSPKYYFTDVGLLCFLLGIRESDQISRDPLVGQIFENLVVIECLKSRYNKGTLPDLYFFRDNKGNEVDLVAQSGRALKAIEIKSASTFSMNQLRGIRRFNSITDKVESSYLIYTGDAHSLSDNISAVHFTSVESIL
ncbi:ATP-binding protein [Puniceicoccales bacterium CK1056]|uniref:ATP-binding protein n=1 Tax=Oceanipulchritudo coccoides TaxID=2706888 RepID=A0A6B2LYX7_9BACT|nr:ATP-binding protein [Oceanipulchritudo coccoides]NDV61362.1 ATP-binding protein [Oceanipulchritudo coccoides]